MSMQVGGADGGGGEPMMDINTTPLIDVLLVLLIMFIITIPIQTHAVKVDLPVNQANPPPILVDPVKNKVVIESSGAVTWNGSPVDDVTLRQYLDATKTMDPEPELHFQPDRQARFAVVDRILAVIKRSGHHQARLHRQRAVSRRVLVPGRSEQEKGGFGRPFLFGSAKVVAQLRRGAARRRGPEPADGSL